MDTEDDIKKRVQSLIEDCDVVVFSKTFCPYCMATKELFEELGQDTCVTELDVSRDGAAIQRTLQELTGQRTVPNVFIKGAHVGGNSAVQAKAASGELQKMLSLATPPGVVRSKSGRDITPELDSAGAIKERIKDLVLSCPVVVFSKSYCPFCRRTKALFASLKQPICALELDQTDEGASIQAALLEITGQRTVPSIFVNGQHIGGNDDAQAKAASGELHKMLAGPS